MVVSVDDEYSLEQALNNWLFDGPAIVIVKGEVFALLNVIEIIN